MSFFEDFTSGENSHKNGYLSLFESLFEKKPLHCLFLVFF